MRPLQGGDLSMVFGILCKASEYPLNLQVLNYFNSLRNK